MSSKETQSQLQTIDGVFNKTDLNLLRYVLPQGEFEVQVLKNEGDVIGPHGKYAKIPDGYSLARVTSTQPGIIKLSSALEEMEAKAQIRSLQDQIAAYGRPIYGLAYAQ